MSPQHNEAIIKELSFGVSMLIKLSLGSFTQNPNTCTYFQGANDFTINTSI
jgi:hypothetical protein